MLSTEINEAAVEFGRALRAAPAVAIYRIAAEALEADPVAQGLLADLRDHQRSLARTQRAGLTPGREQIDRMRLCQAAVRATIGRYAFTSFIARRCAMIASFPRTASAALGADYASLIAPSGC
jgi:cell fate (sporulation/competence/biofilm development) regulator YlbF (YheA/YmcA/DUF963 family)